jgi:flagellin-like protein
MKKRGLSPIIATVLLVSLTLVLAMIIFVWARSFVGEKIQKFDEPVEYSCERVNFEAEVYDNKIHVVNRGNVPLYGLEIRQAGFGSVVGVEPLKATIASGETETIDLSPSISGNLILVPIILGESGSDTKAFTCDDNFGIEVSA